MAKKKNKSSSLFVGGEMVKNGKITIEYGNNKGAWYKETITRKQALDLLAQDTPENYPPEEGW